MPLPIYYLLLTDMAQSMFSDNQSIEGERVKSLDGETAPRLLLLVEHCRAPAAIPLPLFFLQNELRVVYTYKMFEILNLPVL